jgi:transposase
MAGLPFTHHAARLTTLIAARGGRARDYVAAIRYLVKEGIQWRAMPADLPHWRTVYDVADGWHRSGATEAMHHQLRRARRIAAGREPRAYSGGRRLPVGEGR